MAELTITIGDKRAVEPVLDHDTFADDCPRQLGESPSDHPSWAEQSDRADTFFASLQQAHDWLTTERTFSLNTPVPLNATGDSPLNGHGGVHAYTQKSPPRGGDLSR